MIICHLYIFYRDICSYLTWNYLDSLEISKFIIKARLTLAHFLNFRVAHEEARCWGQKDKVKSPTVS